MTNTKPIYDLEERTYKFAQAVGSFVRSFNKDIVTHEYVKQLIRSSSSIGANYIEANEALSKKDFVMRIKISKKEAKETIYWLRLIDRKNDELKFRLIQEATEIMKIMGAILEKSK